MFEKASPEELKKFINGTREIVVHEMQLVSFMEHANNIVLKIFPLPTQEAKATLTEKDKMGIVYEHVLLSAMFLELLSKESAEQFKKMAKLELPDQVYELARKELCRR